MQLVFRTVARGTVPLLAVSFLVFGSGIAPQHAHESGVPHSPPTVHSHFEPHHQLAHHDDHTLELDHGDQIVWLDVPVVHGLPFQFHAPVAVLTTLPELVVSPRHWSPIVFDEAAPPHGPPRDAASPRAPPAVPPSHS